MENTVPLHMASPSRMEVRKVIREKDDPTAARASAPRNLPTINTTLTSTLNVYDVMKAGTVVLTKDAVKTIEEVYA